MCNVVNEIDFQKLKSILLEHSDETDISLDMNTRIAEDLSILGDDVDDLLLRISTEFGTDFSDFIFSDYFAGEASADMTYLSLCNDKSSYSFLRITDTVLKWFWFIFYSGKQYKSLLVRDLYDAIKRGKW